MPDPLQPQNTFSLSTRDLAPQAGAPVALDDDLDYGALAASLSPEETDFLARLDLDGPDDSYQASPLFQQIVQRLQPATAPRRPSAGPLAAQGASSAPAAAPEPPDPRVPQGGALDMVKALQLDQPETWSGTERRPLRENPNRPAMPQASGSPFWNTVQGLAAIPGGAFTAGLDALVDQPGNLAAGARAAWDEAVRLGRGMPETTLGRPEAPVPHSGGADLARRGTIDPKDAWIADLALDPLNFMGNPAVDALALGKAGVLGAKALVTAAAKSGVVAHGATMFPNFAKALAEAASALRDTKAARKAERVVVAGRPIRVVPHAVARRAGETLVPLDVAAFDQAWQREGGFYVGPQGQGGITGRYERVSDFLQNPGTASMDAPSVAVNAEGRVGFTDGRHRFAYLRDQGLTTVPVSMSAESAAHAQRLGLLAKAAKRKATPVIKAWHGGPHDLGWFDSLKIGTGEGGASYSHGHYLAEQRAVAEEYQRELGEWVPAFNGTPTQTAAEDMAHDILTRQARWGQAEARQDAYGTRKWFLVDAPGAWSTEGYPTQAAAQAVLDDAGSLAAALREVDRWAAAGVFKGPNEAEAIRDVKAALEAHHGKALERVSTGKLYQANIHADPAHFLDWDTPVRTQPAVIERLKRAGLVAADDPKYPGRLEIRNAEGHTLGWLDDATGEELIDILTDDAGAPEAVSHHLKNAGIPGVRYLDQGSRRSGPGFQKFLQAAKGDWLAAQKAARAAGMPENMIPTRNYVVFDDRIIEAVTKNGEPIVVTAKSPAAVAEIQALFPSGQVSAQAIVKRLAANHRVSGEARTALLHAADRLGKRTVGAAELHALAQGQAYTAPRVALGRVDSVQALQALAERGRMHQATGTFTKAERAATTPVSSGELAGYSAADIAKFFIERRGGDAHAGAYNLVKALHAEGQPVSAALWDEVVTKPPAGYVRQGEAYVPRPTGATGGAGGGGTPPASAPGKKVVRVVGDTPEAVAHFTVAPAERIDGRLLLSTRVPTGKKLVPGDGSPLVTGVAEIARDPVLMQKIAEKLREAPMMARYRHLNDRGLLDAAVEVMAQNIDALIAMQPAENVKQSRIWYQGGHNLGNTFAAEIGVNGEIGSAVLASQSPSKEWNQNVELAHRIMQTWRENGRTDPVFTQEIFDHYLRRALAAGESWVRQHKLTGPAKDGYLAVRAKAQEATRAYIGHRWSDLPLEQRAKMTRAFDELHKPQQYPIFAPDGSIAKPVALTGGAKPRPMVLTWQSNEFIMDALSILDDPSPFNISTQLGKGHKVRSFFNNLNVPFDPRSLTSDTHHVGGAHFRPMGGSAPEVLLVMGGPGSAPTGIKGAHGVFRDAGVLAVKNRPDLGLLPNQGQSVSWESIKGLFSPSQRTDTVFVEQVKAIWEEFARGKISLEEVHGRIYDLAGGIDPPEWAP